MTEEMTREVKPERLPDFQTQILNNGITVMLSETDKKITLDISDLYLVKDIYGAINVRDMLSDVIDNYFNRTEKIDSCDTCENCDCDDCVGPCYTK